MARRHAKGNGNDKAARRAARLPVSRALLIRGWLVLFWERALPAFWSLAGGIGSYAVLAWTGLLQSLPGWLHAILLALIVLATLWLLVRALTGMRWPRRQDVLRRLEQDSGLDHRPLSTFDDQLALAGSPAGASAYTLALWRRHRADVAVAAAGGLRLDLPRTDMAGRDPHALRILLLLALVVFGVTAGGERWQLLRAGLVPEFGGAPPVPVAFDLWITPPAYTGLPPRSLSRGVGGAASQQTGEGAGDADTAATGFKVPAGSVLLGRLGPADTAPALDLAGQQAPFQAMSDGASWRIEQKLDRSGTLKLTAGGRTLGSWQIDLIADLPPSVELVEPPVPTARQSIRVSYHAADDYGLASLKLRLSLAVPQPDLALPVEGLEGGVLTVPLPLAGNGPRDIRAISYPDLTAHPWAGLPVNATLVATDATDQSTETAPVRFTLPEREFHHPLARILAAFRRDLVEHGLSVRQVIANQLAGIAATPDLYGGDTGVFLGLRVAATGLMLAHGVEDVAPVARLLWQMALHLDEGGVASAADELRAAQEALRQALDDPNSTDAQISQLVNRLKQAVQNYVQALAEQAARNPASLQPPQSGAQVLTPEALQERLDRLGDLARTGARDAARQALAELQQMMENAQASQGQGSEQAGGQAGQIMQGLDKLARDQQGLLDETFRRAQGAPPAGGAAGQQGPGSMPGNQGQMAPGENGQGFSGPDMQDAARRAARQEELRNALSRILQGIGEMSGQIPDELGKAELGMRSAAGALQQGDDRAAADAQGKALDALRKGARQFMDQLASQAQGQGGQGAQGQTGGQGRPGQRGTDPFGRDDQVGEQMGSGSDVKVPSRSEVQRARDVLDELRRRAADRNRPPEELDYLQRLLRRF
ncbi:TIGR02302 family protein [Radicibacter daui]|uniref:TIGR02302 family protein n=1 Tax=Radicibacter daui TaxID=3064829 RepID=UPI004046CFC3